MRNLLIVLFILFSVISCVRREVKTSSIFGKTMGTTYSIKISPEVDKIRLLKIKQGIKGVLNRINSKMSTFIKDSSLSILNKGAAHKSLTIDAELFHIIKRSITFNILTNRAFDITVGPLVNLWGFGAKGKRRDTPPDKLSVETILKKIGSDKLILDATKSTITKDNELIYIDLSAMAKGYGVDEVSRYLTQSGYKDHMVEIGGEIRVSGFKNRRPTKFWKIGIEAPNISKRENRKIIEVSDMAMATSGDYRNFFTHNGKRYSHTIDPRTGNPIDHKLTSVTVLHARCMDADALATSLMVMGEIEGPKFADELYIIALFFIRDENGKIKEVASQEMKEYLKEREVK